MGKISDMKQQKENT